jgi:hypothetical protein
VTATTKELVLRALSYMRGDDYERAKRVFSHCTLEQMQEVWSGNGETRQQVLDGYRVRVEAIDTAVAEVKSL